MRIYAEEDWLDRKGMFEIHYAFFFQIGYKIR